MLIGKLSISDQQLKTHPWLVSLVSFDYLTSLYLGTIIHPVSYYLNNVDDFLLFRKENHFCDIFSQDFNIENIISDDDESL